MYLLGFHFGGCNFGLESFFSFRSLTELKINIYVSNTLLNLLGGENWPLPSKQDEKKLCSKILNSEV